MTETFKNINIDLLIPFENHPFKKRDGIENEELKESVKENGLLQPIIVHSFSAGTYEIISGHRRVEACKELGIQTVPAIVREMSVQSMMGILSSFDAIYDRMNAAERRDLVKYLISEVELFPREEQKTQKRFVKAIAYKFPIEQKVLTQFDECGASVETVCLMSRKEK